MRSTVRLYVCFSVCVCDECVPGEGPSPCGTVMVVTAQREAEKVIKP